MSASELTMAFGPSQSRFIYDEKLHFEKQVPLGELMWLDRERCIQCARCIRFQDEVAGEQFSASISVDVIHRSFHSLNLV